MTTEEFNRWYAEYCAAFPGTKEFVDKGGNAKITLGFWFNMLKPFDLDVANTVTMRMLAGHDEPVPIVDRAQIPRRVAELCQRYNDRQRLEKLPPEPVLPKGTKAAQWDTPKILDQLIERARSGGDVEALSKRLMPIDEESEHRYRCLLCRDGGLVKVWHVDSMELAARGELKVGGNGHNGGCYCTAIRCSCNTGARYDNIAWGPLDPKTNKPKRTTPIIYNPRQWRICKGFKQADIDDLVEFMNNYKPANYVDAFDDYNAQATL